MGMTRREILLASLGLVLGGCAGRRSDNLTSSRAAGASAAPAPAWNRATPAKPVYAPPPAAVAPVVRAPVPMASGFSAIPRSAWASTGPNLSTINPMNGVTRITVHHEGFRPFWSADTRTTAIRLEQIRRTHTADRGWADIGYHYIVDRAGNVWEGRDIRYQGAHVKDNNEHNLGIMLLGNFEQQTPTQTQLTTLQSTLRFMMARHRVPVSRVYTHRELGKTACPGRNLQPRVASLRSSGALA